jgi:Flp pilus assembly pilin Flp
MNSLVEWTLIIGLIIVLIFGVIILFIGEIGAVLNNIANMIP